METDKEKLVILMKVEPGIFCCDDWFRRSLQCSFVQRLILIPKQMLLEAL